MIKKAKILLVLTIFCFNLFGWFSLNVYADLWEDRNVVDKKFLTEKKQKKSSIRDLSKAVEEIKKDQNFRKFSKSTTPNKNSANTGQVEGNILTLNTNKSLYQENEKAYFQMAVLDRLGHTLCDADLDLKIVFPDGSAHNPQVQKSGVCEGDSYSDQPDYFSELVLGASGLYTVELRDSASGKSIYDSFQVSNDSPFSIERKSLTRIYPQALYEMEVVIKASEKFKGQVTETVPIDFLLKDKESIKRQSDQIITWDIDLEAGESKTISYMFDAPNDSPKVYSLGPLQLLDNNTLIFKEFRSWNLAIDVASFISAGTIAVDTGGGCAITPSPPTHQADDIIIVSAYNAAGATMSTSTSGWLEITEVDGTDNIAWYWKRATGAGTAGPDITSGSTDCFGIAYIIRGAVTSGTPYEDATTAGTGSSASSTPTTASIDTTGPDRFVVNFLAHNDNTGWSSGNPPNGWDLDDESTSASGTQVGFNVISQTKSSAGNVAQATVGTLAASELWSSLTLAFIPPSVTLSGHAYSAEGSGALTTKTVNLRVNGAGTYTDDTDGSGVWSIDAVVSSGSVVTVYLDNETEEGTTVMVSDGTAKSDIDIYQNRLIVRHDTGSSITPDNLFTGDDADDDVKYSVSASSNGNLTVDSGFELHIWTGDTFDASGGTVTTQGSADLHVDDNATAILDTATNTIADDALVDGGATLRINGSTGINGGDITTSGTSAVVTTTAGTPTVTISTTGSIGGGTTPTLTFYNLSTSGTGTTTIANVTTVNNDVSIGSGTTLQNNAALSVTSDVTVAGKLTVAAGLSITGGDLTTSGTGVSGVSINYSNSPTTIIDSASEAHTLGGGTGTITFYNLTTNGASQTTTVSTNNIIIDNGLSVGASHTFAMGTNSLTIGSTSISDSGDITMASGATSSQSSSGTVTILGNSNAADWSGPGTFTAYNLTIGNGSATMTVDNETNDLPLDVNNTFTNTANATFQASSTGSFTVGGNWSNNSSAVFTPGTGRVTLDSTSGTPTISPGGDSFYNLNIDNGGTSITWDLSGALDVNGSIFIDTSNNLNADGNQVNVAGNWTNNGTYSPAGNLTIFDGVVDTTQTIDGNTTFNDLTATTGDRVLVFDDADTFTIDSTGTFTITGDSCTALVVIRSDSKGNPFDITKTGAVSFSYVDFQDVTLSASGTAANSVDSGGNSNLTIAANACVSASTDSSAISTGYSFQRKTFFDSENSRHWLFIHDGDEIEARYSTDGSTWSNPATAASAHFTYDTNDFSVWWSSISTVEYVWLAVASGDDILIRRGTLSTTDITWDSDVITALDGSGASDTYSYPYFSLDSSNYMWVGARYYDGSNYVYKAVRSDASDTADATWDTGIGFGTTVTSAQISDDQTNANVFGNIVPLASQDMYATFVVDTAIEGCKWIHSELAWKDSAGSSSCSPVAGGPGESEGSSSRGTGGVKISDADNQGTMEQSTRLIVQDSAGELYAFVHDTTSCEIWKSSDGSSWSEQDDVDNPTCSNSGSLPLIGDMVIDSEDKIHVIYPEGTTTMSYMIFDATEGQDSWDTVIGEETVITLSANVNRIALDIDSNNKPHVIASSTSSDYINYTNRISGSWKSAVTIDNNTQAKTYLDIVINEDNIPEIAYIMLTDEDLTAGVGNQNDATSFTLQDIDTDINESGGSFAGGLSMGIDIEGNTWITYVDDTGVLDTTSDDEVALVKHNDLDAWTTWQSTIDNNNLGTEPSMAIIGKTIFLVYENDDTVNDDIVLDSYDSGTQKWSGETILAVGTFRDAKLRYSKYNFHEPWLMDYLYSDGTDIYWGYIDMRPTKIQDANNQGVLPGAGHQIVRTKSGDYYTFVNDSGSCELWKSSDGYNWGEQDSANNPVCISGDPVALAIDNNDTPHIVYTVLNVDVLEIWSNTVGGDTFDTAAQIGTSDLYNSTAQIDLAIDSNNVPHIAYSDVSSSTKALYNNKIGGSWNTAGVVLETVTGAPSVHSMSIAIDEDNLPLVAYINSSSDDLTAWSGDDNDPDALAQWNEYDVDTDVNDTDGERGASIAVDTLTGDTWIAYVRNDDTTDDITLAKRGDGSETTSWSTGWTIDITKSDVGFEPSIGIAGSSDIYVFYENDTDDISYNLYNGTSWGAETVLHTGTFQDAKAKWSFEFNNYGANKIDYLFSDGTDIYWDYLYLRRSPTNIDNASDFGSLAQTAGKQVVRTSTGVLYVAIEDPNVLEVWKSSDNGSSWAQQDSADSPGIDHSAEIAVDSSNTLHIVYADETTLEPRYIPFNTTTDQFGAEASIHASADAHRIHVSIDSNDIPHVIYADATADKLYYSNKVGGSWDASPIEVDSSWAISSPGIFFTLTISDENFAEIAYQEVNVLIAVVADANDPTSVSNFTFQTLDSSVESTDFKTANSIGVDSAGNTWISYIDNDGANDFVTLAKHADGDAWTTWTTDITNSKVGDEPSLVIDGTDIYVFYDNDQQDVLFDKYNGTSWSGETLLEEHGSFLQQVRPRWSYINNYDSTGVATAQTNTYYFDGSDAAASDPNSAWSDDANAFDASNDTVATTVTTGSVSTGFLKAEGTNGPADGGTITSVKGRVYGDVICDTDSVNAAIYTNGLGELLGTAQNNIPSIFSWDSYTTLSAPSGGWTWSAVQALEVKIYGSLNNCSGGDVGKVEILIQSTNSEAQTEYDYVYSDGTDVFYNRLLLGGSVPGTQDSIATTTNGTQYSISAVSDAASPNDVHLLYLDDSSTKKVLYKRWDNNGASSAWQSAATVEDSGSTTYQYISLTLDTSSKDLWAAFVDQTSDDDVYYVRCDVESTTDECDASAEWDTNPTSESTATGAVYNSLTTNYSSTGNVFGIWTNTSASPFSVSWSSINAVGSNSAPSAPTTLYTNESDTGASAGVADPVGVGDASPVFSAVNVDADDGDVADKYEIIVYSDSGCTAQVWDSGTNGTAMTNCTEGNRCSDINFGGTDLPFDGVKYYWKIKYWDDEPAAGSFSDCSDNFTMLSPAEQLKHGNYFFNQSTERKYTW